MSKSDRPNILLIMSDQHSKHVLGCYGNPIASTPNLDALASRGVAFSNAYCSYPLCAPSRMSFLTGRHPHEIQAFTNALQLPSDVPTFAHALGSHGYDTVLCGRMHFGGPDQRHGFQARIFPEVSGSSAGDLAGANRFYRASMEKSGPGRNHYLLYDEECAQAACRWLSDRASQKSRTDPFCLVVGLVGPHCPFVCPEDIFMSYFHRVDLPTFSPSDHAELHPYSRRFRERSRLLDLTEHEIRRTRAAYYKMVEFDDRLIGTVLDALEETGLGEDTVVIYTSDHGEMAGERGMWWKMSFYDGSCGVPLIASWPRGFGEGRWVDSPVSLMDMAPTLVELTGAPSMPSVTAQSLLGLAEGDGVDPDRSIFAEMYPNQWSDQGPCGGPARMLRRGRWKCNTYHNEPPELFDLQEDPGETVDRSQDPGCALQLETMVRDILKGWDPEVIALQAENMKGRLAYIRRAPGGPALLASEYWRGPEGYGSVDPV